MAKEKFINEVTIDGTVVLAKLMDKFHAKKADGKTPLYRYVLSIGGSRSGKTYAACQMLLMIAMERKTKILICRADSFEMISSTVQNDMIEIMDALGIYSLDAHNKTSNEIRFPNKSVIKFLSVQPGSATSKVKGLSSDIVFFNEVSAFDYNQFTELVMRCTQQVLMDSNPIRGHHFMDDLVEDVKCGYVHSTWRDNNYLPQVQIDQIEGLRHTNYNLWLQYDQGLKPVAEAQILTGTKIYTEVPFGTSIVTFGLDLGFNDPCVLIKTTHHSNGNIYVEELIYKSKLTTDQLIEDMNKLMSKEDKRCNIYCDHRPEVVEALKLKGFKVSNAVKDIRAGINTLQQSKLFININSSNLIREVDGYSWKTNRSGVILDEVVDFDNHCCDAMRYSIHSHIKNKKKFNTMFSF